MFKAVFPAHAGVILRLSLDRLELASFSRTRGGDPERAYLAGASAQFFPHTRG